MKFSKKFIAAGTEFATFEKSVPAPYFRRAFTLGKVRKAELTICGLGIYDLYINGKRITRGLLSPYLSNPDDILYYDNYDLAPYLVEGENVIGVLLGNGFLNCFGGQVWDFHTAVFRSAPKLALTFEAVLDNEAGETVEFDATEGFKTAESPIYLDDIRIGEFYDARRELDGWNKAGYDDSTWKSPIAADTPRGDCRICDVDPILPTKELKPVSVKPGKITEIFHNKHNMLNDLSDDIMFGFGEGEENKDGFIYDFGVNAAGLCRLHIKNAVAGQKIVMQFAEKLSEDGGIDLRGMSFLPHRYDHREIYICKGGDETYMPSLTYHGFRYCLVTGIEAAQATPDLLTYVVMNTALKSRGSFTCSDDVTNKLVDAAIVSDLANFFHFPTDCPHREKNGWTADAALSAEQVITYLTPERNYREWMRNICKSMRDDGAIPGIIPTSGWGFAWGNGPAWDIILVNLPYYTWLYRGETQMLAETAPFLMRYLHYITTRRDEKGLIHIGLGDWCPTGRHGRTVAPLEFTDTAICIDICHKASKIFEVLGMKAQKAFAEAVGDEFMTAARKYLIDHRSMTAIGRCQSTQAMAIYYNIFTDGEKPAAFANLMKMIHENGDSFDCGVLGLRVLFHVLSDFGESNLAYRMITKKEFPSYGYQIACGATSLWEDFRLDSDHPNSRNHHFFGDIISWFMQNLAGIRVNPYEENPSDIQLAPKFVDALSYAEGCYDSINGKVSVSWKRDGNTIVYRYTVPQGIRAELVMENGFKMDDGLTWKRISGSGEVRVIRADDIDKFTIVV